jgi:hemolysin activation/secretion protein
MYRRCFIERPYVDALRLFSGFGILLFLSSTAFLPSVSAAEADAAHYSVQEYMVKGGASIPTNMFSSVFSKYTGTNITLGELVKAASDLQSEYRNLGYTNVSVAVAQEQITNGIVTVNVFRAVKPQILISGKCYPSSSGESTVAVQKQPPKPATAATATNAPPTTAKTATLARTNAPPGVLVRAYEITGDTLLSTNTLMGILAKHTGTNVVVSEIVQAAADLQMEYRNRGYPTVKVVLPPQTLTNGFVKIRVFQGRLSDITVYKNQYFSSNNVMRALPSLQPGVILSSPIIQAELDRANQNQDRQIYPQLEEGDQTNTTKLVLEVHDRLPLHGKIELNNQSSPGTPQLRLNSSAVYNNLWQLEHSLGVQYSFSPESFKMGDEWNFYDRPLVANYSGFYRLPLGSPEAVAGAVAGQPGSFGYDEASRKFRLPPPSGVPELNFYASRSTIDTGLEQSAADQIYNVPGVRQVFRQDVQEDKTINNALGFRLSEPLPQFNHVRSTLSAGLDYKIYDLTSTKTNVFNFTEITLNSFGQPNPPVISTVESPVPTTERTVHYLPLSLRWDASRPDKYGSTSLGLGFSANVLGRFFSGSEANFRNAAGSGQATGYYQVLTGSLARDQLLFKEWHLGVRLDGQWANQPLISNEQFGIGGLNGVRGYREGEILADTGWRVTSELKTPPQVIGLVYGKNPLVVRGSIFMDYAEAYLLDPQGRIPRLPLWGTGFGAAASIGPHFEARLLFGWPLISTTTTEAYQPRLDFGLSFQF